MAKLPAAAAIAATLMATLSLFPSPASAQPYTNHTVGGKSGWFFNATTNTTSANYTDWATTQTFFLGDYLIFNTNSNLTVVQTYNATTYGLCSADEDDGDQTFVYVDDGNEGFGVAETVALPLTVEGDNYYFSDAGDDDVQCAKGMRFQIKVGKGQGLPPELNQPPPPPYGAAPPPAVAAGSGGSSNGNAKTSTNGASGAGTGKARFLVATALLALGVL